MSQGLAESRSSRWTLERKVVAAILGLISVWANSGPSRRVLIRGETLATFSGHQETVHTMLPDVNAVTPLLRSLGASVKQTGPTIGAAAMLQPRLSVAMKEPAVTPRRSGRAGVAATCATLDGFVCLVGGDLRQQRSSARRRH